MKWLNKVLGIGALVLGAFTFSPKKAEACSSAKPIGRGETNVAVADDASAAYWNPAGLVQLERPELDLTFGWGYNYKCFLCYGQPLSENSALGINVTHRINITYINNGEQIEKTELETNWLKLGYSRKLNENLFAGTNLTLRKDYFQGNEIKYDDSFYIKDLLLAADIGLLYKFNDRAKFGVLLQDLKNLRPGLSFKLDDKTLLALEGYDVLGVCKRSNGEDWKNYHLGLEKKVSSALSLRTGLSFWDDNNLRNSSIGASYRKGNLETSAALVHWKSSGNSLLLNLNKRF